MKGPRRLSPARAGMIPTLACLVLVGLACGGGTSGGSDETGTAAAEQGARDASTAATPSGGQNVAGTITATFDGEPRTWYLVSGHVEGEPAATAMWMTSPADPSGRRRAMLAGFDTPNVPVETVLSSPTGGEFSFADYRGSMLQITFPFEPEDSGKLVRFPGGDGAVLYIAHVEGEELDVSQMYGFEEGTLDVKLIDASRDGRSEFAGTFEGLLVRMDRTDSIRVADGSFEITGATYFEPDPDALAEMGLGGQQ